MKKTLPNISLISTLPVFMSVSIAAFAIWYFNAPQLAVPLILGVIAGGLVDLDNRLRGRVKDLGIVLAAFATSSLAVQLTLAHPAAYIAAMLLMTFTFTYIGAVGLRYRTIAFGALVVAIYTTLAYTAALPWYANPLLILLGTVLYGGCTLLTQILTTTTPRARPGLRLPTLPSSRPSTAAAAPSSTGCAASTATRAPHGCCATTSPRRTSTNASAPPMWTTANWQKN